MAGLYGILDKPANIAGFVVIYGYVFSFKFNLNPPMPSQCSLNSGI